MACCASFPLKCVHRGNERTGGLHEEHSFCWSCGQRFPSFLGFGILLIVYLFLVGIWIGSCINILHLFFLWLVFATVICSNKKRYMCPRSGWCHLEPSSQLSVHVLLFCTEAGLRDMIFPGLRLSLHTPSGRVHHSVLIAWNLGNSAIGILPS